jgi:hypothetical protein
MIIPTTTPTRNVMIVVELNSGTLMVVVAAAARMLTA